MFITYVRGPAALARNSQKVAVTQQAVVAVARQDAAESAAGELDICGACIVVECSMHACSCSSGTASQAGCTGSFALLTSVRGPLPAGRAPLLVGAER